MDIYPIIMAGGAGSRLWPVSRELFPKQFIRLCGQDSMLQTTVKRMQHSDFNIMAPLLICNEEHRFLAAEQLREMRCLTGNIILEPVGRNTAPAITLAALHTVKQHPQAIILVLAADHLIENVTVFNQAITSAYNFAQQDKLVTFGIVPHYAEPGYGYIKKGQALHSETYCVAQFVEKPDEETAQHYLQSGSYVWNSGMFMFKAQRYLDELEQFRPDILSACQRALSKVAIDLDFIRIDRTEFSSCPSESIDYAIMEKTQSAVVVEMDAGWSDVGCWGALWEVGHKDNQENVLQGDVISINATNNFVRAEDKLVVLSDVDNLVVIETKDAVLVIDKNSSQNVKKVIDKLKTDKRREHIIHREVYRPWGKYDGIDKGERYQVKRIVVRPGQALSTQMHHHRAEHWIVVVGTAKVRLDDKYHILTENESIYIPLGILHSLENPGKIDLHLIEIQSGSYLEDDDIIRFDNRYE